MTETQIKEANAKIAEWLGWKENKYNSIYSTHQKTGEVIAKKHLPDYFSNSLPVETRIEMVARLTYDERVKLFEVWKAELNHPLTFADILLLDQPTLAELVCKIKGWI